jgi:hypothetical protein
MPDPKVAVLGSTYRHLVLKRALSEPQPSGTALIPGEDPTEEFSMTMIPHLALLFLAVLAACTPTEPAAPADTGTAPDAGVMLDAGATTDASNPPENPAPVFTHKMMKRTGENMFASLAYECPTCTFEQHQAIVPPTGWMKGPSQVALFSRGELRSTPSFEGVPDAVDFVAEVPGNEYTLIAKNLDATIVANGADGLVVQTQVMRDTLLRWSAGMRVHELTDPEGNVFVLFAYGVDPTNVVIPDFQDAAVLADFSGPEGWVYSTRILDEELLLDSPDIATVLAIRGATHSTWEMR